MTIEPKWLHDQVLSGIQALMALRLKGAPSMENIASTAQVWVIAIRSRPIAWEERLDTGRINQAFVDLAATAENWPSPAAFLNKLQPRAFQNKLAAPVENKMSPKTRALVDGMLKKMRAHNQGSSQ